MKQYHDHLKAILSEGTRKKPSREGMPGSISLFGYQNSYNLQEGFPILTTKKVSFKNIVVELLWFLRGDTNIKYLVDNGCNIWIEDAYNYYLKNWGEGMGGTIEYWKQQNIEPPIPLSFEDFVRIIKEEPEKAKQQGNCFFGAHGPYELGDCGFQYGKVWRDWVGTPFVEELNSDRGTMWKHVDQITRVVSSLKSNSEGRRHIVTAIDPAHDNDLALYWCHCMFQFNTRELTRVERVNYLASKLPKEVDLKYNSTDNDNEVDGYLEDEDVPKYYLDCQLYQRSADMFLGVPYNISSYALLTHIIAKICNMVPGRFIHTFGDSHIYDNHLEQVQEILSRDPEKYKLPTLQLSQITRWEDLGNDGRFDVLTPLHFTLEGYESYPPIKAKLSTGLK